MNKKKFLIIGLVAFALAAGPYASRYFIKSNPEAAELTTASVLDAPVSERCDFQDEIDEKFLGLDASSGNYDVLYRSLSRKYSDEKYSECEIPESRKEANEFDEDSEPVVENVSELESEITVLDSTYYERAYNYVPEVPTPVFEYPAL